MSEWKEYKLQDAIEKFIDYRGKTPNKVNKGIPLITAKVIKDGSILKPDEFIKESEYLSWMTRGFPEINDVLLTTEAPLGEVAIINDNNIALAQRIILLRGKPKLLNNSFLFYSLRDGLMQHRLKARASGSTVQGIKSSELKEVLIPLPDIEEQKRIADVLSCLDRKIDNLRRQNETLEEIARSIFKYWFIDFEFPNPDGKPYKSSGGAMVRSDLGDIPEGWRVQRFDSLGELNRGKSRHRPRYAEHLYGGIYPFIQTGDIKSSQGFITEYEQTYSNAGLAQSRLWEKETLCITIAANIAETGILTFSTCFPDSVIGFVADASVCDVYFIHRMFKIKKKEIEIEAIGSVQKNLNLETISKIKFVIPNIEEQNDLIMMFRKLGNKIICTKQKIQTLTKTRDTLLPKLMSGQLRVKE